MAFAEWGDLVKCREDLMMSRAPDNRPSMAHAPEGEQAPPPVFGVLAVAASLSARRE